MVYGNRPSLRALRIVFSAILANLAAALAVSMSGCAGRLRRSRCPGRELHQLVELIPMRHRCAALPLLYLLSRDAELGAEHALCHAQLRPQIEHIDGRANALARQRAEPRRVSALRRPKSLLPP
jgi:hypothetical protein